RFRRAVDEPFACPALAEFNTTARKVDTALAEPIPGYALDMRGFAFELLELTKSAVAPRVRAAMILSAVDPTRGVALAPRGLPALPNPTLPPDGKPVKVPTGVPFFDVWAAMRGQLIGAAMGDGAVEELGRYMAQPLAADAPALAFAFDIEKLRAAL